MILKKCMLCSKTTIRRMRFTTQWRAAFRVKSLMAVVVRRKWLRGGGVWGGGGRGRGERGSGRRLEIIDGGATSQVARLYSRLFLLG